MAGAELDAFGQALIREVRDRALAESDRLASGAVKGPDGDRWRTLLDQRSGEHHAALADLVRALAPDIVDQVLFELLDSIDTGRLPLAWKSRDGNWLSLLELGAGESAGWLVGAGGWRSHYSTQRYSGEASDLRLAPDEDAPAGPPPSDLG
jgi:hypothetical protein